MPALEIFADMVLHPHLDDDEFEPIRALCLQNLRSLEDDPGSKVIYELRRRHFPDPWGRPSPGTPEGVSSLTPEDLREFLAASYRPNGAILGVAGSDRLAEASRLRSASCSAAGRPSPRRRWSERPAGPHRDHIVRETQQIQIALAYPAATVAQPRLLPGAGHHGDPGRLFLGPAFHRGPREARVVLLGLRRLRRPARPRGHALLRGNLDRPGASKPST